MINNFLAALLGLIFVTLAKMSSTKKDFESAGHTFVTSKFLRDEFIGLMSSIAFILLMAVTVNEWVAISSKVAAFVTCIFGMGGAIGSWAFLLFLGKSKKYIRTVIDLKTNAFDNEVGKTGTITEIKEKAADAGKDISKPTP
jgi:hypothetical protein